MRADVNLSVREVGASEFGTRTEMKNLNSFKAIARAIEGERARQIELDRGRAKRSSRRHRRWDDNEGIFVCDAFQRGCTGLPIFSGSRSCADPNQRRVDRSGERTPAGTCRMRKQSVTKKNLIFRSTTSVLLTGSKKLADIFEETTAICHNPKKVSNWLMVETMRLLKEKEMEPEDITFTPENLAALIRTDR